MLPCSGDRRGSPRPHAAFSSLSPSAAPFTVDGPHPADPTVPSPSLDLPTAPSLYAAGEWGSASWMDPPVSYMAPVAATAPLGYKGEVSDSAPYGIYSGNHFGNFVDLYPLRIVSSKSICDKHPGTYRESSEALSNGFGLPVQRQQQNAFVSKLVNHIGAEDTGHYHLRQDLNQYPSGSAYDKYMTQLSSCSDTQTPILSTPSANSSEVAKRMVPAMNDTFGESSFSFSPYMNPCRINLDYFDYMHSEQKDLGYQTTDKHHGNWSNSVGSMTKGGTQPLNSLGENHHVGEYLGNGRPVQQPSEMKYDLRDLNPNKVEPPEVGFVQPCEFSSELLEVNNLIVDSPCWKGTPIAYRPSFGNETSHSLKGTGDYNNSHQGQKPPELSSKYSELFSRHQEASASENDPLKMFKLHVRHKNSEDHKEVPLVGVRVNNDMASHSSYLPEKQQARRQKCYGFGEDSKNVIIASQQERFCPLSKATLLYEHTGSHIASITEESSKEVPSPIGCAPRVPVENLISESLLGNISSEAVEAEESTHSQILMKGGQEHTHCYPGAEENMLKMSSDYSSRTQTIFLKLMHNLSVLLLSTCNGGSSLHEYEEELLQSVIQNLEDASSKRSKVKLKADDGLSNFSQIRLENTSCLRNNFWVAMPEHRENTDSEFKTSISKALTKLPGDKMLDDAEVSQVLIYKNLWIEAEASACKLKYELQLARTKLATMKGHNNTQTVLVDSSEGGKASSSTISNSKPQNHAKGSIACAATFECHEGDSGDSQSPVDMVNRSILNGVDADVFARLGVLRSRIDNVSSFGEDNCEEQQEASKKSFAVEDAVLARLGVLKSCPDSIISLGLESSKHQLDACANRSDEVDDAVMARLRILKSRPDNISSLGQESSKHQLDACTNIEDKVDNAVIARLRILKCRNDNINSLGDVSKQHEEACNDQSNWDKDGVVGKIQVLSGGIGNNTSIAEGCPKPLHSDDLADHSEGQDSVGGLETIGDATGGAENNVNGSVSTADVAAPNRCKAPSDEVNDKSAIQCEDGFVVNHAWPQTTGDSHGCTAGSQETPLISSSVHQYDRFPPEWEHVLKENFFHPGK